MFIPSATFIVAGSVGARARRMMRKGEWVSRRRRRRRRRRAEGKVKTIFSFKSTHQSCSTCLESMNPPHLAVPMVAQQWEQHSAHQLSYFDHALCTHPVLHALFGLTSYDCLSEVSQCKLHTHFAAPRFHNSKDQRFRRRHHWALLSTVLRASSQWTRSIHSSGKSLDHSNRES